MDQQHIKSAVCGSFVGGCLVAAAALFLGKRGVVSLRRHGQKEVAELSTALQRHIRNDLQKIRQDITSSVASSESRLLGGLQTQERAINASIVPHLANLQTGLKAITHTHSTIKNLTVQVADLGKVLNSPKTRGIFGEQQLESLVKDIMPPGAFSFQTSLATNVRPDCVLMLPPPIGRLCIDAKFPLTAFQELCDANVSNPTAVREAQVAARKRLSMHLRNHVKAINEKYIIPGETADSAVLFLPSEAIFAELIQHHAPVLSEAHAQRVWICSPTTLMAVLTTMRAVVRDVTFQEHETRIFKELEAVLKDIDRVLAHREQVDKHFKKAVESLRLMDVSAEKARRRGLVLRDLQLGDRIDEA